MARLQSTKTRVIVNVDDATAARLGPEWVEPGTVPSTEAEGGTPKGNASREVWAAYADSLGVEYAEDAKRDDIKAAVAAATAEDDASGDDDPAGDGSTDE